MIWLCAGIGICAAFVAFFSGVAVGYDESTKGRCLECHKRIDESD